jgi:hypothetical protein
MTALPDLPTTVARHFPDGVALGDPLGRSLAIGRLLEDGDRADLAWLAAVVDRAEIAAWLDRHGARRLSRRSRAFWFTAFDRAPQAAPANAQALWPLA